MSCGKTDPLTLSSLTFLGYEFRKVRDRLFGTGKRYLHFGPSPKSVKRVCQEVHKHTHSRNVLLPVDVVVDRVNKLLEGWGGERALVQRVEARRACSRRQGARRRDSRAVEGR